MFQVKICGVTNIEDAEAAVDAGADAIGLNFFSGSKRFVSTEKARQIVGAFGERAVSVGVFVNASAQAICDACRDAALNTIQLHGKMRPDHTKIMFGLRNRVVSVIHAHSFGTGGLEAVYKDMFDSTGEAADAVLVDAAVSGMYGGTGQAIDWTRLVNFDKSIGRMPLILAGGLTPENVAEAISVVRPHAVDVASGVEASPGKKDPAKMRDFIAAARDAFKHI